METNTVPNNTAQHELLTKEWYEKQNTTIKSVLRDAYQEATQCSSRTIDYHIKAWDEMLQNHFTRTAKAKGFI